MSLLLRAAAAVDRVPLALFITLFAVVWLVGSIAILWVCTVPRHIADRAALDRARALASLPPLATLPAHPLPNGAVRHAPPRTRS